MKWTIRKNPMRDDGYFVCEDAPQEFYDGVARLDGSRIAKSPNAIVQHQLPEETARLIAAAPDLLTALERSVEVMQFAYMNAPEQPKEIAQALAAIAKAKGGRA